MGTSVVVSFVHNSSNLNHLAIHGLSYIMSDINTVIKVTNIVNIVFCQVLFYNIFQT